MKKVYRTTAYIIGDEVTLDNRGHPDNEAELWDVVEHWSKEGSGWDKMADDQYTKDNEWFRVEVEM